MTITLYGYATSPFVRKVACYLHYKKLSFEFVGVSPVEPEKTIGFTKGSQVPVLKIGDEWRLDSSSIGLWLDEVYPERRLVSDNAEDREIALAIDQWISEQFIPGIVFRPALDGEMNEGFKKRAWRLASIVSSGAELSETVQKSWPDLLRQAPFIHHIVNQLDLSEPLEAMQMRLFMELTQYLDTGPYLGKLDKPSLADFAIYAQMMFFYQVGLVKDLPVLAHPTVGPWLKRVSEHLPQNPWCVDETFITNSWPFG
ncbi:glutathione S-transferase family protein [Temperatibacter marinus]|uniref:Glutathione S-transferase family protein n=1 Tax=Temperatibacter marinus TaxID=1456591 RepID=A0AA52ECN6_9PROT|nr:glutathione S-transferase family protein [Temperatibacter marinus]WND02987.1 glutathione S-transferase family protein [Temperatibacter marinus]